MNYTNEQLQAAIDAAISQSKHAVLVARTYYDGWDETANIRLAIARAFLAELGKIKAATTDDPYARLKAYAKAGARIKCDLKWAKGIVWDWCLPANQYEVHPDDLHLVPEYAPKHPDAQENWNQYADRPAWTLPAPPTGRRWHGEDWKPEWLEGGYRPLLDGEVIEVGDEYCPCGFGPWQPAALDSRAYCVGVRVNSRAVRFRTRRPLPSWSQASAEPIQKAEEMGVDLDAKPEEPAWIPHNGGPCPLKDEEVEEWEVQYDDGDKAVLGFEPSSGAGWGTKEGPYIAYRVLKWKPGYGPEARPKPDGWTPEMKQKLDEAMKHPGAAEPAPPMIRLRLPSEKPTKEDADETGYIFLTYKGKATGVIPIVKWPWDKPLDGDELAWFSLPEGLRPKPPTQEELWRKEFEEEWKNVSTVYSDSLKEDMWHFFLAAKKGGQS